MEKNHLLSSFKSKSVNTFILFLSFRFVWQKDFQYSEFETSKYLHRGYETFNKSLLIFISHKHP
jgi:hypothetical protein